jgi:hypothetical protein
MPTMEPPPMTDFFPSSSCMLRPARRLSSRNGVAAVQQPCNAFTGQQLLALLELVALGLRLGNHQTFETLDFGQQALHALGVGGETFGPGLDLGTDDRHVHISLL